MKKKTNNVQVATKKDIQMLRNDFKKSEKSLRGESLRVEGKVEVLQYSFAIQYRRLVGLRNEVWFCQRVEQPFTF